MSDCPVVLSRVREAITALESVVAKEPQVEIPVTHYHANVGTKQGLYAREMKCKKDQLVVGKIHKLETINVISSGEVSIISQDGKMRVKAPYTFVSTAGAKRAILCHEDATWTCFHATGETDLSKIEEEFIAEDYDALGLTEKLKVIG